MESLLKKVHIFNGLNEDEISKIAAICTVVDAKPGDLVIEQNTTGNEVYIIADGAIDVFIKDDEGQDRSLIVLGRGQLFGEMALLDQGFRSASGRAGRSGCTLYKMTNGDFYGLCEAKTHIGYIVMRNFAIDLAFKLRHLNLTAL